MFLLHTHKYFYANLIQIDHQCNMTRICPIAKMHCSVYLLYSFFILLTIFSLKHFVLNDLDPLEINKTVFIHKIHGLLFSRAYELFHSLWSCTHLQT